MKVTQRGSKGAKEGKLLKIIKILHIKNNFFRYFYDTIYLLFIYYQFT